MRVSVRSDCREGAGLAGVGAVTGVEVVGQVRGIKKREALAAYAHGLSEAQCWELTH